VTLQLTNLRDTSSCSVLGPNLS